MLSPFINMAINKHKGKILPSIKLTFQSRTRKISEITSAVLLAAFHYSLR